MCQARHWCGRTRKKNNEVLLLLLLFCFVLLFYLGLKKSHINWEEQEWGHKMPEVLRNVPYHSFAIKMLQQSCAWEHHRCGTRWSQSGNRRLIFSKPLWCYRRFPAFHDFRRPGKHSYNYRSTAAPVCLSLSRFICLHRHLVSLIPSPFSSLWSGATQLSARHRKGNTSSASHLQKHGPRTTCSPFALFFFKSG